MYFYDRSYFMAPNKIARLVATRNHACVHRPIPPPFINATCIPHGEFTFLCCRVAWLDKTLARHGRSDVNFSASFPIRSTMIATRKTSSLYLQAREGKMTDRHCLPGSPPSVLWCLFVVVNVF